MLALVLRGIVARPARAALTASAVLIGVAIIAGTLVFTDTIDRALSDAFSAAARGTDVVVAPRGETSSFAQQPPSIPDRVVRRIRALPGVERAVGEIDDNAAIVGRHGGLVGGARGHTRAFSYAGPPFQAVTFTAGRAPQTSREVAIDAGTAAGEHFRLGSVVRISTQRPVQRFRLVGLVRFGGTARLGVALVVFTLPSAQTLFHRSGRVDRIDVAGRPGRSPEQLAQGIAPLLNPRLVVRSGSAQAAVERDRVASQLSYLTEALLALGFIAVLVGAFVIFNSFSITVAQRTRELALLRTLGVTRRQLLGAVVGEALLVGLLASAAAVGAGLGAAAGIRALLGWFGLRLPSAAPVLEARTVLICLAVGLLTTLAAALRPAQRATRLAPAAALRADETAPPASRLAAAQPWLAGLLTLAGAALTLYGATGGAGVGIAAAGAIAVTVGVALLGPWLVPAAARVAGWPLERMRGLSGQLARENAVRNPPRTAAAAAALMVGLALVLFVATFAGEARSAIRDLVAHSFAGDFAVSGAGGSEPIPQAAANAVASVPGVQTVSVLKRSSAAVVGSGASTANGIDTQTLGSTYRFAWTSGSDELLGFLGPNGALVERDLARRADLHVGSHFTAVTPAGKHTELTVRGIYRDRALLPGFAVALPTFDEVFHQQRARRILIRLAPNTDPALQQRRIARALRAFPEARVRTEQQLANDEAGRLDSALYLIYGLLALSVMVALFGLVNTLTLQAHERRRELGVLRALGASRRSLRTMVRYESYITAAIGAALGLVLGLFFAAVVTAALADEGFSFAPSWPVVALLLVLALVLGVLAAGPPARRAARLDMLDAIAHE